MNAQTVGSVVRCLKIYFFPPLQFQKGDYKAHACQAHEDFTGTLTFTSTQHQKEVINDRAVLPARIPQY